jgi:hypothetical protein
MRALFWTVTVLVAALGLVGFIAWLNSHGPQLGQPIRIGPTRASTNQYNSEATNFRVRDRVFHETFGLGTIVAADGPKLTIDFDNGGMKRVVDSFVVRSDEPRPSQ